MNVKVREKALIALAIIAFIPVLYFVASTFAQEGRFEAPSKIIELKIAHMGPGALEAAEPLGWYRVPIGGTLPPYSGHVYGPYYPYAIYVCIESMSPNVGLDVSIIVGGSVAWFGDLYAGQCSPTVSANALETYVTISNGFAVSITYSGSIWLYTP